MKLIIGLIVLLFGSSAYAGQYADAIGVYLPDSEGKCKSSVVYGYEVSDGIVSGVCMPFHVLVSDKLKDIRMLAIIELTDPDKLQLMERYLAKKSSPTVAYSVQIDKKNDDIFKLVDGSILEGHRGQVLNVEIW